MTAVAEDLALSRVTFTAWDDAPECCATIPAQCPQQAVARFVWHVTCSCAPCERFYCARHRDMMSESASRALFCARCYARVALLRIEALQ